jgi:hypothetical protein
MAELERTLERKIGKWCKDNGYLYYKFTSPAKRNVPDRLVVAPGGKVGFLELKRKGNKPTDGQAAEIFKLIEKGCTADWVDNYEDAIKFLEDLRS